MQLVGCFLVLSGTVLSRIFYCTQQRDFYSQGFCPLILHSDVRLAEKIRLTTDTQLMGVGAMMIAIGWFL